MCTPDTLADAAHRAGRDAADQHGGARGLPDPVRLRSTTTRSRSSSWCRPPAASAPSWPRRCSRCSRPTPLRRAVAGDDVKTLTAVPGIGQKGAQRIILELKDRIGAPGVGRGDRAPPAAPPTPWRDQVQPGPGRARLVGQGGRPGGRGGRRPRPSDGTPDVAGAAARRPAHPEQGLSRWHRRDELDAATRRPTSPSADRRRGRGRRARRRGGAAAAHPRRGGRPGAGPRAARRWCSRRPGAAGGRPTTCCCPARPGSARPRWR